MGNIKPIALRYLVEAFSERLVLDTAKLTGKVCQNWYIYGPPFNFQRHG